MNNSDDDGEAAVAAAERLLSLESDRESARQASSSAIEETDLPAEIAVGRRSGAPTPVRVGTTDERTLLLSNVGTTRTGPITVTPVAGTIEVEVTARPDALEAGERAEMVVELTPREAGFTTVPVSIETKTGEDTTARLPVRAVSDDPGGIAGLDGSSLSAEEGAAVGTLGVVGLAALKYLRGGRETPGEDDA